MNWFTWRQHRRQYLVMGFILALFAALTIPTGEHFWSTYQKMLASCALNPANPSCDNISNSFQSVTDQILFKFLPVSIMLLMIIFGIFWGAPVIAKEYAEGTNSLVWTQSVSRRKWLSIKLLWLFVATIIFASAFVGLFTWWSRTSNALYLNRFDYLPFETQGIVPVALGIFAVAIGTLFGAWFKKTLVAVGAILVIFIALVMIVIPGFARPQYLAPITTNVAIGGEENSIPSNAWVLTRNIIDKNGKVVNDIFAAAPIDCRKLIQDLNSPGTATSIRIQYQTDPSVGRPINNCLNRAGFHRSIKYQPDSRYWEFQFIEAGIYLALAALAIGATFLVVLKRDA